MMEKIRAVIQAPKISGKERISDYDYVVGMVEIPVRTAPDRLRPGDYQYPGVPALA